MFNFTTHKLTPSALVFFLFLCTNIVSAQYQIGLIPRTSPDNTISLKLGFTDVQIKYGSPFLKGRELWGKLEPYDQVWRSGANEATTVSFSDDVEIMGKQLKKGTYALFMIPRQEKAWTIIFSTNSKQWGAFGYKQEEDALRLEIVPEQLQNTVERLTYKIEQQQAYSSGNIHMEWGKTRISIPFSVKYIDLLKNKIHSRLDSVETNLKWVVYLQGAEFLVNQKEEVDQAQEWINQSKKLLEQDGGKWNKSSYFSGHITWVEAKIMALKGDFKNAVSLAKTLKNPEKKNKFYSREKDYEKIDRTIKIWKNKISDKK